MRWNCDACSVCGKSQRTNQTAIMPSPEHFALWQKLESLDLDGDATLPFSKRLARDNGWTHPFALRVVGEYRRFLFLAATCGHPVTPSDEVDQAWHQHLVYTRSYWDELCGEILGFPLHHGPTQGGSKEGAKFHNWYERTLDSYLAAFGEEAPRDVWPPSSVRFGEATSFRRVNLKRVWVVRKPFRGVFKGVSTRPAFPKTISKLAPLLLLLVVAGCTAPTTLNPFDFNGEQFLTLFWSLCLLLLPASLIVRQVLAGPHDDRFAQTPSPHHLARLSKRGAGALDSALAALSHEGKVRFDGDRAYQADFSPPTDPWERSVWNAIGPNGALHLVLRQKVFHPNNPALQQLDGALERDGLLLSLARRTQLNLIPVWTALALGAFGLVKVVVGLSRGKPVMFLVFSLVALGIFAAISATHSAWTTGRGGRLLQTMRERFGRGARREILVGPETVALAVALWGVGELSAFGMSDARRFMAPASSGGDGGSSGGDGGGGGGGCGGGGCGGCGGS